MFIMEAKNYNRKKNGRNHKRIGILFFLGIAVTFLPPLFKSQIVTNTPQIGIGNDLLLTTFLPQVHQQICRVSNNKVGVGGKEVNIPSFEIMLYTVQQGDTLSEIAYNEGLNLDTIISANQEVKNLNLLRAGQTLRIPNQKGVFHKVKKGQTINNIASTYKTSSENILEANNISNSKEELIAGKEIFIPGAKLLPSGKEYLLGNIGFIRPVSSGWLSDKYGYRTDPFTGEIRFHTGIDIACYQGTPIRAAKNGKVIYSGWRNGYGNMVVIKHTDGYFTRYAHTMRNLVDEGNYVQQGQIIALVGNTGRSIGPHLHFEICKNGRFVNPASFISLPSHRIKD